MVAPEARLGSKMRRFELLVGPALVAVAAVQGRHVRSVATLRQVARIMMKVVKDVRPAASYNGGGARWR